MQYQILSVYVKLCILHTCGCHDNHALRELDCPMLSYYLLKHTANVLASIEDVWDFLRGWWLDEPLVWATQ